MTTTASKPGTTVCASGPEPVLQGTAHGSSVKTGLLLKANTDVYDNGYEPCGAAYGTSNTGESVVRQCEIEARHEQTTTPYDKNNIAYSAGDPIGYVEHVRDHAYWLPCNGLTVPKDGILITAPNGLVEEQTAHTSTPLPHHAWSAVYAVSNKNWVLGKYLGFKSMFTA